MGNAAVVAVLAAPVAAGLTALVWQFPIIMAGNSGGDLGSVIGAVFSMIVMMTIFSFFGGTLAIALAGAGAGYLVRRESLRSHVVAGVAVGVVAALVVAVSGAFLTADSVALR